MDNKLLGYRVKQKRKAMGLSQEELAHLVGYKGKSIISRIENGEVDLPKSRIEEISDVLRCEPSYLMGLSSGEISMEFLESKMRTLDNAALDRIIKYAEYLKTLQGGD